MRTPHTRIDLLASAPQYLDHLAPVWHALNGRRWRHSKACSHALTTRASAPGSGPKDRTTLVASVGDLRRVRDAGRSHVALIEHGIGMSYAGNHDWAARSTGDRWSDGGCGRRERGSASLAHLRFRPRFVLENQTSEVRTWPVDVRKAG